ncbi:hypothetical protein KCU81_g465, partial [Aureobasidium melanogenum]
MIRFLDRRLDFTTYLGHTQYRYPHWSGGVVPRWRRVKGFEMGGVSWRSLDAQSTIHRGQGGLGLTTETP